MILTVPFNQPLQNSSSITLLKTLDNSISQIMNVIGNAEVGPCFVVKAHQVTVTPYPSGYAPRELVAATFTQM